MPVIHYGAVLLGTLLVFVWGALWYGPFFGRKWSLGMGFDLSTKEKEKVEAMQKEAVPAYFGQLLGTLLMAFVVAHILWAFSKAAPELSGWQAGLTGAFWMWLGLIFPVKLGEKLWAKRSLAVFLIDASYYLCSLIILSITLSVWK